jgi:hypothetical protein
MNDFAGTKPQGTRRHDGVISLIIQGQHPGYRSATEILELARSTSFAEDAGVNHSYTGGSIDYTPAPLSEGFSQLEALVAGRLLYRFRINESPPGSFRALSPGTYYTYVDFVEGPDFDEGRWIGRIINEYGQTMGVVPGVEVKQVISFHIDEELREIHSKPQMHVHGIGADADTLLFRADAGAGDAGAGDAGAPSWAVTSGNWIRFGNGCALTFFCTPQTLAQ